MAFEASTVEVGFLGRVEGLFSSLDKLSTKLENLTSGDNEINISVDDSPIAMLDAMATSLDNVTAKVDTLQNKFTGFLQTSTTELTKFRAAFDGALNGNAINNFGRGFSAQGGQGLANVTSIASRRVNTPAVAANVGESPEFSRLVRLLTDVVRNASGARGGGARGVGNFGSTLTVQGRDNGFGRLLQSTRADVGQFTQQIGQTFDELPKLIAAQIVEGKPLIDKAFDQMLVPIEEQGRHRSPPARGRLRATEMSFALMGKTIGDQMLQGTQALRDGTRQLFTRGLSGLNQFAQGLISDPFRAAGRLAAGAIRGIGEAAAQATTAVGGLVSFIPVIGPLLGGVARGLAGITRIFSGLLASLTLGLSNAIPTFLRTFSNGLVRLLRLAQNVADAVKQISREAARAGQTVTEFDRSRRAFARFNVDATEVTQSLLLLRQNVAQATSEGGQYADTFNRIGLTAQSAATSGVDAIFRLAGATAGLIEDSEEYNRVLESAGANLTNLRTALTDLPGLVRAFTQAGEGALITEEDVRTVSQVRGIFRQIGEFVEDLRRTFITQFFGSLTEAGQILEEQLERFGGLRGVFNGILAGVTAIARAAGNIIGQVTRFIRDTIAVDGVDGFKDALRGVRDFGLSIAEDVGVRIVQVLGRVFALLIATLVGELPNFVAQFVARLGPLLASALVAALASAFTAIVSTFLSILGALARTLGIRNLESAVADTQRDLTQSLANGISAAFSIDDETAEDIKASIEGIFNDLPQITDDAFSKLENQSPRLAELLRGIARATTGTFDDAKTALDELTAAALTNAEKLRAVLLNLAAPLTDSQRLQGALGLTEDFRKLGESLNDSDGGDVFGFSRGFSANAARVSESLKTLTSLTSQLGSVQTAFAEALAGDLAEQDIRLLRADLSAGTISNEQFATDLQTIRDESLERAKAQAADVFASFSEQVNESINNAVQSGFDPETIGAIGGALQESLNDLVSTVGGNVPFFSELASSFDIRSLFQNAANAASGLNLELQAMAAATETIGQFSEGLGIELINAADATTALNNRTEIFLQQLRALDEQRQDARRFQQTAQGEVELEASAELRAIESVIEEIRRRIGADSTELEVLEAQTRELQRAADILREATENSNRFESFAGVLEAGTALAGEFGQVLLGGALAGERTRLELERITAELGKVTTENRTEVLGFFEDWFGITGSIEESVDQIGQKLQAAIERNNALNAARALRDEFSQINDVITSAFESNRFESFRDVVADTNRLVAATRLEFEATRLEVEGTVRTLADRGPAGLERLQELATTLQAAGTISLDFDIENASADQIADAIASATAAALDEELRNIALGPITDIIERNIAAPLTSSFSNVFRGLADGSILEAARTAREAAQAAGIEFSETLFVVAQLGEQIFNSALDTFLENLTERMTDALTNALVNAFTGDLVDGAIEGLTSELTQSLQLIGPAVLGVLGLVLSRLQSEASTIRDNVESAIEETESIRGVVSGQQNVAIAEVGEQLAEANAPIVSRLDVIIGLILQGLSGEGAEVPVTPFAGTAATTL